MIGRRFDDPVVQSEIPRWPFLVLEDQNFIKINVLSKLYLPEDISSLILKELKKNAELYLDTVVKDVVIAIPAYFNDAQRKATLKAAAKARLNVRITIRVHLTCTLYLIFILEVLRLISEPSAAALAYGLDKYYRGKRTIMIYDLGGGTFDVSILKIGDGHFQTLATTGDTHLGGQDFDNRLFDHLVQKFKTDFSVDLNVYNDDADKKRKEKAKRKLKEKCQAAKHQLSGADRVQIAIESFYRDLDYIEIVNRKLFEDLNRDLFEITMKCVEEAMTGAKLEPDNIDDIILVGGSTKIPIIQEIIKKSFKKSKIVKTINSDEAVAVGAALEAARIAKLTPENFRVSEVTPFSLGIKLYNDKFRKVIDRFSATPITKSHVFRTSEDYQTSAQFLVFEGENQLCVENNLIGNFVIEDVPALPEGEAEFFVTFNIDQNGVLTVTGRDVQTGNQKSIKIEYGKCTLSGVETRN